MADIFIVSLTLIFISIWDGLNLVLYYKFGYSKMKFIGTIFIFSTPFILPRITKYFEKSIHLSSSLNINFASLIMIIVSIVIYLLSLYLSLKFFSKRDL